MDKKNFFQKSAVVTLLALFCTFLWGSAFPCIKVGYTLFQIDNTASKLLFAGLRFTLAGFMTIVVGSIAKGHILIPQKESLPEIGVLCLFQTVIQYVFFYLGLANTTGVKGSILESTNVFFVIIIACFIFRQEKLTFAKIISCVLGFAGVLFVNLDGLKLSGSFSLQGEGFLIISSLSYAFSSVFMKKFSDKENPVMLSGYQFILGGIIMTVISLLFGGKVSPTSYKAYLLLLYMAFISAAAYGIWSILLKYNKASNVTVFSFMNTVFGTLLSAVILREYSSLNYKTLLALVLVCSGIIISNKIKESQN